MSNFPRLALLSAALLLPVASAQTATVQTSTVQSVSTQTAPASTLKLPAGVQYVASAEGISEYRLNNGLRVLLAPSQANAVMTQHVTYLVGSVQEGAGEGGMAHLLEHMLFKGSAAHKDIPGELRQHGASFNAETTAEYTDYYANLNASRENLDFITALEADRMVNSFIDPQALKSEMTVVMNEFDNGENNPGGLLYKAVHKAAYSFHPIGRDVVGNRSEVEKVPAQSLKTFYQKYYQPDNAVVTLSGNFDPQYALERLNVTFGKIPRPKRTLVADYAVEPPQQGEKTVSVRRVGSVPLLMTAYHIPGANHPDAAALQVLQALMGQAPEGRLYQALVASKLASDVGNDTDSFAVPGLDYFNAALPAGSTPQQLDKARAALEAVAEGVPQRPYTQAEVTQILKRFQVAFDRLSSNPAQTADSLISVLPTGDWRSFFVQRDAILKVTAADVNRVAAQYLKPSNRTAGTFYPTPKPDLVSVPASPSVTALLKDFKPRQIVAAGEAIDTRPEALEKRTVRGQVAGLQAAYFQKKTQDGRVLLRLSLDTGNLQTADNARLRDAADYIVPMLLRGSVGLTPEQLKDQLSALNASLDIDGDAQSLTLSVAAPPEHLAEVLALARRILRTPTWPQADFDELKRSALTSLQGQQDDPQTQARHALARAFDVPGAAPGSHNYTRNDQELLRDQQQVTLDDVKAAYTRLWGYAGSGQLAVVGPFERGVVDKNVADLLAGWRAQVAYQRVPDELTTPKGQTITVPVADKTGAVYLAAQSVPLKIDSPDYAPLEVAAEILGGDPLSSRLATKLRQQGGRSYDSGLDVSVGSRDAVGRIMVSATTGPSGMPQTEAGVREVLQEALQKGFSADEVGRIKAAALQSQVANRSTDSYLLRALLSQAYLGQTFADTARRDAALQAVTPQQASAALKKYLDPQKLVVVKAGSF